ncbi:MAG: cell division protein FtsA [Synergistaceae bacterium]|nr:cell division protein FtsA [Synergistaceae bacterium]
MFTESDTLTGLCVGTTKIAVIVAEREYSSRRETVRISGIGSAPSEGIRKGAIVNLDAAVRSVRKAVREAENIVGYKLTEAMVSFNAVDVSSVMSSGMVSLGRGPRPIQVEDVERVIEAAQSELSIPTNKVVALHTIPVRYSIDSSGDIDDPMGMTGMRLAMNLQTVTVPKPDVHNVVNCVRGAGIERVSLVIKPITSALGALTEEEMRRGAISLSLGGGTTGLAFYKDGRPIKVGIVPIGGDHITNDLASVLRLPLSEAEELKKRIFASEDEDDNFSFLGAKGQPKKTIDPDVAVDIISARFEELFVEHVGVMIPDRDPKQFPAGIVLSGGVAKTKGIDVLLSDIFKMPVRVADPEDYYQMPLGREGADYISAIGTIRYILNKERYPFRFIDEPMIDTLHGGSLPDKTGPAVRNDKQKPSAAWKHVKKFAEKLKESFRELF